MRRVLILSCAVFVLASVGQPATADPAFITREAALARSNTVVAAGTTASQYKVRSPGADATFDLRGLTSTAYPYGSTYPVSFGTGTGGSNTVVVGGTVTGGAPLTETWQTLKSTYDGAALLLIGRDQLVSYDLRGTDVFDFFRPRTSGDLNSGTFLLDGCYGSWIRDDAIENDHEMSGTIRDCVFDGVSMGVSLGQSVTNPSAVTTIENSTFIFRPMPNTSASDGSGHGVLFKMMGGGSVVLRDVIVCYEETPILAYRLTNWMPGSYSGVTVVLGPRFDGDKDGSVTDLDHPGSLPSGVTQSRDWSLCQPRTPHEVASAPSPVPTPTPTPSPVPAPSVVAFAPTSGAAGTAVAIDGSGFSGATEVAFGDIRVASFRVESDGRITTAVPSAATTGRITVTTPSGLGAGPVDFVVTPAGPTSTVLTSGVRADTYVASAAPRQNFGAASTIRSEDDPATDMLIKLDASGIRGRTVTGAILRLYATDDAPSGGTFFPVSDLSWRELGVTWRSAPPASGPAIASLGPVTTGTWYDVDVSSLIRRDGTFALRVDAATPDAVTFASDEGTSAHRPQLILTVS